MSEWQSDTEYVTSMEKIIFHLHLERVIDYLRKNEYKLEKDSTLKLGETVETKNKGNY